MDTKGTPIPSLCCSIKTSSSERFRLHLLKLQLLTFSQTTTVFPSHLQPHYIMDNSFFPDMSHLQPYQAPFPITDSYVLPTTSFSFNDSGYASANTTHRSSWSSYPMSNPALPLSISPSNALYQSPISYSPASVQQEVRSRSDGSVYSSTMCFCPPVQRRQARTRQSLPNLPSHSRPLPPLRPRHDSRVSKRAPPPPPRRHTPPSNARQEMRPMDPATQLPLSPEKTYHETSAENAGVRFYCQVKDCDTVKAKDGFARKSDLSRHMKLHQSEKLTCKFCRVNGKNCHEYSRKDNLKQSVIHVAHLSLILWRLIWVNRHIRNVHRYENFDDDRLQWFNDIKDKYPRVPDDDEDVTPLEPLLPRRRQHVRHPSNLPPPTAIHFPSPAPADVPQKPFDTADISAIDIFGPLIYLGMQRTSELLQRQLAAAPPGPPSRYIRSGPFARNDIAYNKLFDSLISLDECRTKV